MLAIVPRLSEIFARGDRECTMLGGVSGVRAVPHGRVLRLLATALHWTEYSSSENYCTVSYDTDFQKDAHIIQGTHSNLRRGRTKEGNTPI